MAKRSLFDDVPQGDRDALAQRIRAMVDECGIQANAAKVAGVSIGQLKAYISGKSVPSLIPIGRLAVATGFDLNWVMTGDGPPRRDGTYTVTDAMRDMPMAQRTRLQARVARKLGSALEALYGGDLEDEIDDTVEPAAIAISELVEDETEALLFIDAMVEMHRRRIER